MRSDLMTLLEKVESARRVQRREVLTLRKQKNHMKMMQIIRRFSRAMKNKYGLPLGLRLQNRGQWHLLTTKNTQPTSTKTLRTSVPGHKERRRIWYRSL